jgi:hypothetical protein
MFTFKKLIPIFVFVLLCLHKLQAVTWKTVSSGNWNAGSIWQGGVAPPASSSDTFIIKHAVFITSDLTFNGPALLKIDSTGGICGHYKMTVYSGAEVIKYGTLDLDTLAIPGGVVNCYQPGSVILSIYGVLTVSGAQLNTYGCSFTVGPWFTCQFYNDAGIEDFDESGFSLFPNPTADKFTITSPGEILQEQPIEIFDLMGNLVLKQNISNKASIDATGLPSGIYTLRINAGKKFISRKLVVVK